MKRAIFLRIMAGVLTGAALVSCVSAPPIASAPDWPGQGVARVRAFVYDCDADASRGFFQKDGTMARGIINGPGALLSAEQVQRLMPALKTGTPRKNHSACYLPHHALVFYDAAGRVLAHTEICFTCTVQRSFPAGLPEHIDFQAVWDILREAEVPCGPGSQFYKDLYKAKQAGQGG